MVSAVNNTTPPTTQPKPDTTGSPLSSSVEFDTFLKMLTTQLKNQDPMNPMEGADFAVQLATFSGVEQQAQTNKLLNQLVSQMGGGSGGLSQIADWIGKEARTTAPVWLGTSPLTLDIKPATSADSVVLVALDSSGREVSREEIGPGSGQIEWLGRNAAGDKLPEGLYSFVLESKKNGEMISEDKVGAYARVTEAEVGKDGLALTFEGGGSALANDITALRDPT